MKLSIKDLLPKSCHVHLRSKLRPSRPDDVSDGDGVTMLVSIDFDPRLLHEDGGLLHSRVYLLKMSRF